MRMHGHGMGGPPTWIGEEAGAEAQQGVHMRPRGLQRSVHCRSWIPARDNNGNSQGGPRIQIQVAVAFCAHSH